MSPLRPAPLPPPETPGELALDVLVRDYPELLAPLRALGIDPAAAGAAPLRTAAGESLDRALAMVARRTAWRAR